MKAECTVNGKNDLNDKLPLDWGNCERAMNAGWKAIDLGFSPHVGREAVRTDTGSGGALGFKPEWPLPNCASRANTGVAGELPWKA